ncbi:hypothetical protein PG984_013403 [Apiospora sp. TS-2023a]
MGTLLAWRRTESRNHTLDLSQASKPVYIPSSTETPEIERWYWSHASALPQTAYTGRRCGSSTKRSISWVRRCMVTYTPLSVHEEAAGAKNDGGPSLINTPPSMAGSTASAYRIPDPKPKSKSLGSWVR